MKYLIKTIILHNPSENLYIGKNFYVKNVYDHVNHRLRWSYSILTGLIVIYEDVSKFNYIIVEYMITDIKIIRKEKLKSIL